MATIIVHGTFSSRKDWWHHRSGDSFGGHLSASLEEAGYGNDVWVIGGRPVESFEALTPKTGFSAWKGRQAPPFDQNDGRFRWTGGDTHSDRLDAGLQLATYLATLASLLGFAGTPMVNAARVDPDHALNGKYDQFEVPAATDHGRDVHSALTDPQVGYVAGRWFASDTESFEQSWYASGVAPIG